MSRPEFFLDRGLGRGVAEGLSDLGWIVHRAVDHFPSDAAFVADAEWMTFGLERGWTPLCKDGRIKARASERQPLVEYRAVLFYLDNQQLLRAEMVRRFRAVEDGIYRRVARGGPAAYAVGADALRKTWP